MKYLLSLLLVTTCFAGTQEQMSAVANLQNADYTMVYQFPLMHRDGSVIQLKLIKFNKPNCITIDGQTGCSGGFTQQVSNYKRRVDTEHPVDTTETINLTFLPGKVPKIDEENLLHELFHAVQFHYMSRSICETNWRYSECMEAQAYDFTYLYKQVVHNKMLLIIK